MCMKALDTSTLALCRSFDSARDPDMSIKIEVRLFIALMLFALLFLVSVLRVSRVTLSRSLPARPPSLPLYL